jgi:hypothetical protein
MKEDFLHYVWKFQKFNARDLTTTSGDKLRIVSVGQHNQNSGPDFFNAQLTINGQFWAGNVEIHIRSSDWYLHHHEDDAAYDNVILHAVWEHDAEVFRKDNTAIPTLEMKFCVQSNTLARYYRLFSIKHKWINCENELDQVDEFILKNWLDWLYIERLEQKSEIILTSLKKSNNHWEGLLFRLLCKNFGLKVNGEAFSSLAASLDFSVIQKSAQTVFNLESLLFGQAGLLNETKEDGYFKKLQKNYTFQKHKFGLDNLTVVTPKYFRLRPPNFPTIRLSQLAVLYVSKKQLFASLISGSFEGQAVKTPEEYYSVFDIAASEYWETHYNFGVSSGKRRKKLSKKFIDLLLINTIIPLQFCYAKYIGKDITEELLQLASGIVCEENTIVKKYKELGFIASDVSQSQAFLQLKNEYCDKMRCLQCAVGNSILKAKTVI